MNRGRWLAVSFISLVLVVSALVLIGFARTPAPSGDPQVRAETLEERGVVFLEEHDLFVVWNDGDPLALTNDAQHLDGDIVLYCRSSGLFESPMHGEKFDGRGYYYGGPALRGLDRYPISVEGGIVTIDVDARQTGPERGEGPAREPEGRFCDAGSAVEEPGFFDH